jgi:hypothetical protein
MDEQVGLLAIVEPCASGISNVLSRLGTFTLLAPEL